MKKQIKLVALTATLLIAAAGVITFEACNKKSEVINNVPQVQSIQYTDMDRAMLSFGEKMKSADRSDDTMPLEEALITLTNYQNFIMCDASNHDGIKTNIKIVSTIHAENGNVTMAEINKLYESVRNQVLENYNNIEEQDKNIYCIFSLIDEEFKNGDDVRIVTMASIFDRGLTPISPIIDETDVWTLCNYEGKCVPYYGQCVGQDAISRLDYILNMILSFPAPAPGYRIYFSDYFNYLLYAVEYIDPNSPNGHYGLIHGEYDSPCLSPDDMRYYRDRALDSINAWILEQQSYNRVLTDVYYSHNSCSAVLAAVFAHVTYTYIGNDD